MDRLIYFDVLFFERFETIRLLSHVLFFRRVLPTALRRAFQRAPLYLHDQGCEHTGPLTFLYYLHLLENNNVHMIGNGCI